jgi:hypothetical protein
MGDMTNIAKEMESMANGVDGTGLAMEEYEEYGFPASHRQRVQFVMDRWENGCCDLEQAAKEMAEIAAEVEGEA